MFSPLLSISSRSPLSVRQTLPLESITWNIATSCLIFHLNFCAIFETALPLNAVAVHGECSFDRSLCGWKNMSLTNKEKKLELTASGAKAGSSPLLPQNNQANHPLGHRLNQGESITWRLASPNSRPSNLQDHTFRAPSKCISHSIHWSHESAGT